MGNVLAQPVRVPVDPLADLPGVVLKDTLGGGRFLKTMLCLHDSGGLVVVKVYFKRPDTVAGGLDPYKQQLAAIRAALSVPSCQHAWPWQAWMESQHVGYLVRQHLAQNLYDRLSTRPFMSKIEKRWVAFQLLLAASQVHGRGVVHGDIKSENVLLSSWGWLFLADFAGGLKPVALPADNPAEYSFFFDTGGRRRAYIAPERFFTADTKPPTALTPEMDIFSLGCVIAEVFCDGKALFDLSALLSYRRGDAAADPAARGALMAVDPDVRRLVLHMIQLDPAARWPAAKYLSDWPEPLFPPYFSSVLHPFFASLLPLDADARVAATAAAFPRLRREILAAVPAAAPPGDTSAAAAGAAGAAGAPKALPAAAATAAPVLAAAGGVASAATPPPTARQPQDSAGATAPGVAAAAAAAASAAGGGHGAGAATGVAGATATSSGPSGVLGGSGAAGGGGGSAAGLGSLLDEVGALLADSGTMARRFKATPGDGGGGGGGMLDSRRGSGSAEDAFLLDGDMDNDGGVGGGGRATGPVLSATGSGPSSALLFAPGGAEAAAAGGSGGPEDGGGGAEHSGSAVAAPGSAAIEEVVTEEVYEYQVREPWGTWQGASSDDDLALVGGSMGVGVGPVGVAAITGARAGGVGGACVGQGAGEVSGAARGGGGSSSTWRGREEVELPRGGGWQWAGAWSVDMRGAQHAGVATAAAGPSVDAEGWEYRSTAGPTGHRTWTAAPDATCTYRRRRWIRQRRRRLAASAPAAALAPPAPLIGTGTAAGVGGASLGRMPSARGVGPPTTAGAGGGGAAANGAAAAATSSPAPQGLDGGALPGAAGAAAADGGTGGVAGGGGDGDGAAARNAGQGLVLVAVLLCSTLRGSRLQESKLCVLRLLVASADACDDHVRLQCVVPYIMTALHDASAAVRCLAVRGIVRTLTRVQALPPSDVKVFQDYVLPSMSLIPNDFEEAVRAEYGMGLAHLAAAAHRHLLRLQNDNNATAAAATAAAAAAAAAAVPSMAPGPAAPPVRYDAEVAAVRSQIERGVVELVTGLRSTVDVKRALLSHVSLLAEAFGRRGVTELLLPLLITCLNAPEGRLRAAFFRAVSSLGPQELGGEALDAFLLPCLEQALTDPEPRVVCDAVRCLVAVTPQLRKRSLLAAAGKVAPLLRHGSPAVRGAAVAMVAAAARHLSLADVYAQLAVLVAPHLRKLPPLLTDQGLLADCLMAPGSVSGGAAAGTIVASGPGAGPEGDGLERELLMLRGHDGDSCGRAYGGGGRSYTRATGSLAVAGAQAETLAAAMDKLSVPLRGGGGPSSGAGSAASALTSAAGAGAGPGGGGAGGLLPSLRAGPAAGSGGGGGCEVPLCAFSGLPLLEGLSGPEDAADLFLRPAAPLYTYDLSTDASAAATAAALAAAGAEGTGGAAAAAAAAIIAATAGGGAAAGAAAAAAVPTAAAAGIPGPGMSAHCVALATLPGRLASLDSRVAALADRLTREPLGVDPLERQHLDRLAGLIARLRSEGGSDVRGAAARNTWRLVSLSQRGPPPLVSSAGPFTGPGAAAAAAAAGGGGDLLAGALQHGDYFSASGGVASAAAGPRAADLSGGGGSGGVWSEPPGSGGGGPAAGGGGGGGGGGGWWRPRGVLVAHLAEHRRGVSRLAVGAGGCFLASASADETVKVWDLRRLERDVSFHSRLTYAAQTGRITALCCCGGPWDAPSAAGGGGGGSGSGSGGVSPWSGGTTVASGSSSGSLHLWRPEYTSRQAGLPDKYTGVVAVRQLSPGQGAVLEVAGWGPHLLLHVTQRGGVAAWDTRTQRDAWVLPAAPELGLAEHLLADPSPAATWIMTGSSRGYVCLWDVRFQTCVHTWRHPLRCPIDAVALATGPPARVPPQAAAAVQHQQQSLQPQVSARRLATAAAAGGPGSGLGSSGCPLVWVAAGQGEAGLWDIVSGKCRQVLRCLGPVEPEAATTAHPPAALAPPPPPPALQPQQSQVAGPAGGVAVVGGGGSALSSLGLDALSQPQPRTAGARCLLSLPGGALLWGGSDAAVRYWDASRPEGSYAVCGPLWPGDTLSDGTPAAGLSVPEYRYMYRTRAIGDVAVCEELCVLDNSSRLTESCHELRGRIRVNDQAHADAVMAMAVADPPGSSRLLLTASRDGVVKAWK